MTIPVVSSKKSYPIQAFMFDLDGTVLDTRRVILQSLEAVINDRLGHAYTPQELTLDVGRPLVYQMERLHPENPQHAIDLYLNHQSNEINQRDIVVYDGVIELLKYIRSKGYKTAVVTSKRTPVALQHLKLNKVDSLFDGVWGADMMPLHKPHPYPIVYGAEHLDVEVSRCVYIGDAPFDIEAANKAGAHSVAVTWGFFNPIDLYSYIPDYIIDKPQELQSCYEM